MLPTGSKLPRSRRYCFESRHVLSAGNPLCAPPPALKSCTGAPQGKYEGSTSWTGPKRLLAPQFIRWSAASRRRSSGPGRSRRLPALGNHIHGHEALKPEGVMTTERPSADWPPLLEEYRRFSQADWDASRLEEDAKPEGGGSVQRTTGGRESHHQL